MMSRLFNRGASCSEHDKGVVLIIMSIAIVVLLALAGLAIDAGNLYAHSISFQKAADAAVLAGMGYSIQLSEDEKDSSRNSTRFYL
jgi:Flp pilus assembly protein TadG